MNILQKMLHAAWALEEARNCRGKGEASPLPVIAALIEFQSTYGPDAEIAEELQHWLTASVGPIVSNFLTPPNQQPEITARAISFWIANQAGANWKNRTAILRAFKAFRKAFPES